MCLCLVIIAGSVRGLDLDCQVIIVSFVWCWCCLGEIPCNCSEHVGRTILNVVYDTDVETIFRLLFTDSDFIRNFNKAEKTISEALPEKLRVWHGIAGVWQENEVVTAEWRCGSRIEVWQQNGGVARGWRSFEVVFYS